MSTQSNDQRADDVIDANNDDEPSTAGDVTEGGLLGAVGGGIVGAIAGGPLGAVIGAIIGGGASAVAVDAVDHHDHDSRVPNEDPDTTTPHMHFDNAGLAVPRSPDTTEERRINDDVPAGYAGPSTTETENYTEVEDQPVVMTYVIEEIPVYDSLDFADLEEVVRLRAYQLWEERGHRDGFADEDWFDAENELRSLSDEDDDIDIEGAVILEEVELYES